MVTPVFGDALLLGEGPVGDDLGLREGHIILEHLALRVPHQRAGRHRNLTVII